MNITLIDRDGQPTKVAKARIEFTLTRDEVIAMLVDSFVTGNDDEPETPNDIAFVSEQLARLFNSKANAKHFIKQLLLFSGTDSYNSDWSKCIDKVKANLPDCYQLIAQHVDVYFPELTLTPSDKEAHAKWLKSQQ